ncbi:hypothetical protein BGW38_009676 [Lunasporangiospora selenospora]|uniref:SCP2 domain-containing protein n=1 Tax=Lunasporangiospora selenospora TaxID=979761 RepID=A0A9P6FZ37_9FUNG|nr:hypothetical protein BGW38_009676 [Lunasporangiospora selenospora]
MSDFAVAGFAASDVIVKINDQLSTLPEADRKEQVKKVKCIFQFNVKNKDGKVATWTLDLKSGSGALHKGTVTGLKPDITIDVADADFVSLAEGKANGQKLFMSGKIKVKGAIMMATKLETVFKGLQGPQAKL